MRYRIMPGVPCSSAVRGRLLAALIIALTLVDANVVGAQTTSSMIEGTVSDSSGAVIAAAAVVFQNRNVRRIDSGIPRVSV
jgi:hypothetical protein